MWILIWSGMTLCVRVLDILMLTGLVVIDAIYHTPDGATLYANVVSEIIVAFPYPLLAFVGSVMLLYFPKDVSGEDLEKALIEELRRYETCDNGSIEMEVLKNKSTEDLNAKPPQPFLLPRS